MWHSHHSFQEVVNMNWNKICPKNLPLKDKLNLMASSLQKWNIESFGNIVTETRQLRKRIDGIQNHPNYSHSDFLQKLEKTLLTEYLDKVNHTETFWAQRARINWLRQGDKNSKFFHASVKIQHNKSTIHLLEDESGGTYTRDGDKCNLA